jgi:phage terminase large subunit
MTAERHMPYKRIFAKYDVSATHWIRRRFFDLKPKNCTTHESTYRDNRFLDAEQVAVLENFKESDRYYYQVYCLGNWGTTGRSVFDAEKVSDRLAEGDAAGTAAEAAAGDGEAARAADRSAVPGV